MNFLLNFLQHIQILFIPLVIYGYFHILKIKILVIKILELIFQIQNFLLSLKKIKKHKNGKHNNAIGYSDRKIRAIIQFSEKHRNERKEIFSYQKSYEILTGFRVEGITSNILLGTIGRVSDGWKFYPKLQPCELNKDKIIFLYKERMS